MCAMNDTERCRSSGKSIIGKVIDYTSSGEPGYISDDEDNYLFAPSNNDRSNLTITCAQSQNAANNYISSNDEARRSSMGGCRPDESGRGVEQKHPLRDDRRSCSTTNLSRSMLKERVTTDSGTGDSLDPSSANVDGVCGQQEVLIFIENRFDFDQRKINEYLDRNKRSRLRDFRKPTQSIETTASLNNKDSKKSSTFFAGLFKSSKRFSVDPPVEQPVFRHHSSCATGSEEQ